MPKYRFIKFQQGHKWYAIGRAAYSLDRRHAVLFTDDDYQKWGEAAGLEKEALGEDQLMKLAGAQPLPGLEGL